MTTSKMTRSEMIEALAQFQFEVALDQGRHWLEDLLIPVLRADIERDAARMTDAELEERYKDECSPDPEDRA